MAIASVAACGGAWRTSWKTGGWPRSLRTMEDLAMSDKRLRCPATKRANYVLDEVLDLAGEGALEVRDIPIADLDGIAASPKPAALAQLRDAWDESLYRPIRVRVTASGAYRLRDGQHRLAIARAHGYTHVECVVLYRPAYWARLISEYNAAVAEASAPRG